MNPVKPVLSARSCNRGEGNVENPTPKFANLGGLIGYFLIRRFCNRGLGASNPILAFKGANLEDGQDICRFEGRLYCAMEG